MPTSTERVAINATARATSLVLTVGDVMVTVKAPAIAGFKTMGEEQVRQTALRQFRRALEVAREELG